MEQEEQASLTNIVTIYLNYLEYRFDDKLTRGILLESSSRVCFVEACFSCFVEEASTPNEVVSAFTQFSQLITQLTRQ